MKKQIKREREREGRCGKECDFGILRDVLKGKLF